MQAREELRDNIPQKDSMAKGIWHRSVILILAVYLSQLVAMGVTDARDASDVLCISAGSAQSDVREIAGYVIRVNHDDQCTARVLSPSGQNVLELKSIEIALVGISGRKITGGPAPNLVLYAMRPSRLPSSQLEYDYFIASLGERFVLLKEVKNRYGITFRPLLDGGPFYLLTRDGSLADVAAVRDIYHFDAVIPDVILRLKGHELLDASSCFRRTYDDWIARARTHVTDEDIRRLRTTGKGGDDVRSSVVRIILLYLYSGRKELAMKAIRDMWPYTDQAGLQTALLKAYNTGILAQTDGSLVCGPSNDMTAG